MKRKPFNQTTGTAIWLGSFILLTIFLAACSRSANYPPAGSATSSNETPKATPKDGPPADVVQASAPKVELTAGGNADALVTVKIATGYHANGNPASEKYLIATSLDVEASDGVTPGKVIYPPSVSKKFSFSPDPIMVYEGEVVVKQSLRADKSAAKGARTLRGKIKVQPCDDTVCYPPRTMDVSIPINVK